MPFLYSQSVHDVHPSDNEVYVRQWISNAKAIAMVHSKSFSKPTPTLRYH